MEYITAYSILLLWIDTVVCNEGARVGKVINKDTQFIGMSIDSIIKLGIIKS